MRNPANDTSTRSPAVHAFADAARNWLVKDRVPSGWLGGKSKNWSKPPRRFPTEQSYIGRARSMILRPPVAIDVISGRAGSSEKSARHSFDSPSVQITESTSADDCTRTGPGFT